VFTRGTAERVGAGLDRNSNRPAGSPDGAWARRLARRRRAAGRRSLHMRLRARRVRCRACGRSARRRPKFGNRDRREASKRRADSRDLRFHLRRRDDRLDRGHGEREIRQREREQPEDAEPKELSASGEAAIASPPCSPCNYWSGKSRPDPPTHHPPKNGNSLVLRSLPHTRPPAALSDGPALFTPEWVDCASSTGMCQARTLTVLSISQGSPSSRGSASGESSASRGLTAPADSARAPRA
jgi:hypothetical protein